MFLGEYQHLVDPKGRVILPARFRQELEGGLIVTKGFEDCLVVYTTADWKKVVDQLRNLPTTKKEARALVRNMLSGASSNTLDRQGRVMIPQNLRDFAGLKKDVIVIGVGNRVEIWDNAKWEKYKKETEKGFSETAEELSDLGI